MQGLIKFDFTSVYKSFDPWVLEDTVGHIGKTPWDMAINRFINRAFVVFKGSHGLYNCRVKKRPLFRYLHN